MIEKNHVGIRSTGIYIPQPRMTAADISQATGGQWATQAVIDKLGIVEKPIPGQGDGTQAMAVQAARHALKRGQVDPKDIDLILSMGEEWKEYPLTTTGIYVQDQIGAVNAWAIDLQQRCCSTVSALKIAKDMMLQDPDLKVCMIVGGYRNGDFVDYGDTQVSMMFNLSAGAGALILERNLGRNALKGSHIMSDGSMARDAGVEIGGTVNPITPANALEAQKSLRLMNAKHMKDRLNAVSMDNWMHCIDKALNKSGATRADIGYLAVLHFKRSMHQFMLGELGLTEDQSIYLENYGHMGQVDQILSLHLAIEENKVKDGDLVAMIAAGIGYAWAAGMVEWGPVERT